MEAALKYLIKTLWFVAFIFLGRLHWRKTQTSRCNRILDRGHSCSLATQNDWLKNWWLEILNMNKHDAITCGFFDCIFWVIGYKYNDSLFSLILSPLFQLLTCNPLSVALASPLSSSIFKSILRSNRMTHNITWINRISNIYSSRNILVNKL